MSNCLFSVYSMQIDISLGLSIILRCECSCMRYNTYVIAIATALIHSKVSSFYYCIKHAIASIPLQENMNVTAFTSIQ